MGNRHSNILHSHLVNRATCISCLWHPLPDILKMKMSIYVKPTLIKWFCVWHEAKCAAECHRDWNGDANDATLDINNNRFTIGRSRLLESCVLPAQPTENCEWRAEIKQKYLQFCCLLLLPHSAAILLLTQCLSYSPAWKLKKVWQLAAHVNISLIADHRSTGCPRTKNLSPLSLSALLHFYLQPKVRDVHAKQHEIYIHIHTSPITMHTLRVSKSKVPMQSFVKYLYANSGAITFSISVSLYYSPMCAYNWIF